jgi:hypothetical protein
MISQGQVGPITATSSLAAGTQAAVRLGNMGEQIVSELHGRYYEATYRRSLFAAANTAAVASVAIAATTYTGLVLANPIGSTVNLVVLKANWAASAAISVADVLVLETGYNASTNVTHTTPITPANTFIGVGASGVGLVDSVATLPTAPVSRVILCSGGTLATTGYAQGPTGALDLEGSIILPPGAYIAFATSSANTAAWWFSLSWEEVPA